MRRLIGERTRLRLCLPDVFRYGTSPRSPGSFVRSGLRYLRRNTPTRRNFRFRQLQVRVIRPWGESMVLRQNRSQTNSSRDELQLNRSSQDELKATHLPKGDSSQSELQPNHSSPDEFTRQCRLNHPRPNPSGSSSGSRLRRRHWRSSATCRRFSATPFLRAISTRSSIGPSRLRSWMLRNRRSALIALRVPGLRFARGRAGECEPRRTELRHDIFQPAFGGLCGSGIRADAPS